MPPGHSIHRDCYAMFQDVPFILYPPLNVVTTNIQLSLLYMLNTKITQSVLTVGLNENTQIKIKFRGTFCSRIILNLPLGYVNKDSSGFRQCRKQ